mmetsp:Transcript_33036/g.77232  ORF Transcript_33036/g.77232 Transcript_33036/m.77232 type:complete len:130 (-) Transcript_33036:413-802(-)
MPDVIYLNGGHIYIAGRGSVPLSAVKPYNFRPNATSGMFTYSISADCKSVTFDAATDLILPSVMMSDECPGCARFNTQRPDFHGISGVGLDQVWALCQSATGSVQSFEIFSACPAYGDDGLLDWTSTMG